MRQKIADFDPNIVFPDCNSSLNSPMALKWCTKLNVLVRRGAQMLFKVICLISRSHGKKSPILSRIERFRTVTPVWIHRWILYDAQSLKSYRRGALLFFEVIHQISRSHRLKNRRFDSSLSKITRPVAAIKSLRFAFLVLNTLYWEPLRVN